MMPTVSTTQLSDLTLEPSGYQPGGFSTRICRASARRQQLGLYKEYTPDKRRELNVFGLECLVRWRQDLPPAVRKFVDLFCAYPRVIVFDGPDVVGILMNEAPTEFIQMRPAREPQPRQADVLGRRRDRAREPEASYFEPPHKLAVLGVLLERLIWLHDQHLVVGDLQPRNLLVTAGTDHREVYFIDCDSFWLGDLHAFPPHSPPMWDVSTNDCNPATDLAKFARLVARATCENFSIDYFPAEKLREVLPSQHVRQLERMWSVDPSFATEKLRSMAHSWANLVRSAPGRPGKMYLWTDSVGRTRWPTPSAPTGPTASATGPTASGTTQAKRGTAPRSAQPTTTHGWRNTRIMVGGIAAVLVLIALLVWALSARAAEIRPAGLGPSRICIQIECSPPPRAR
jgi:hypothetical protein